MAQITLVGAGHMGFAMLSRWLVNTAYRYVVVERSDAFRARAEEAGARAYANLDELPAGHKANVVVIATKPAAVGEVAKQRSIELGARPYARIDTNRLHDGEPGGHAYRPKSLTFSITTKVLV